jgi:hypothetical protein
MSPNNELIQKVQQHLSVLFAEQIEDELEAMEHNSVITEEEWKQLSPLIYNVSVKVENTGV